MIIGLIGPSDSIKQIQTYEDELPKNLKIKPYYAHSLQDAIEIAEKCQSEVDGILFTGQSVHGAVISKKHIHKPNRYVPHSAFSILSLIFNQVDSEINNLSIDVVSDKVISEIPIDIDYFSLNTLPYEVYHSEEDYIAFHEENIQNRSQAIITTFASIKSYFKSKGVPVYRLYTTKFDVKYTIKLLKLEIEKRVSSNSRIGVQMIKLTGVDKNQKYDFKKKQLDFERQLNEYARNCSGTMIHTSNESYIVYATQRVLNSEEHVSMFFAILEDSPFTIYSGIAFGNTVYQAEVHAKRALASAENETTGNLFIFDEHYALKGPFKNSSTSVHEPMMDKKELEIISQKVDLSAQYIKRINRIIKTKNVNTFTAKEFAHYLNISKRSSNRILKKFIDGGYGEVIDTIKVNKTGRPFNVIKILL